MTIIYTLICDDSDAQAYEGDTTDGTFDDDDGEFSGGDYNDIDGDDNNVVLDVGQAAANSYQYHRFEFSVNPDTDVITNITVTWKGYGGNQTTDFPPSYNYGHSLWVKESGSWSEKDNGTSSSKETLTMSKTSSFSEWITAGILEVAAQSDHDGLSGTPEEQSFLNSYYIEVVVTYVLGQPICITGETGKSVYVIKKGLRTSINDVI